MSPEAVKATYYSTVNPKTGAHPFGETVMHLNALLEVREHGVDVSAEFSESLSPEYLRPEAVDIIEDYLQAGGEVYIWTVGDSEVQKRKIQSSLLIEKLIERFGYTAAAAEYVKQKLRLCIYDSNKLAGLDGIIAKVDNYASEIRVVDDKYEHIKYVQDRFSQRGTSKPPVNGYKINNGDSQGDLAAFKKFLAKKLQTQPPMVEDTAETPPHEKIPVLIIDWDDTLWSEQARVAVFASRIAYLANAA